MKLYTVYLKYNRIIPRESSTETRDTIFKTFIAVEKLTQRFRVPRRIPEASRSAASGWRKSGYRSPAGNHRKSTVRETAAEIVRRFRQGPEEHSNDRERARPLFLLADRHRPLVIETAQRKKRENRRIGERGSKKRDSHLPDGTV